MIVLRYHASLLSPLPHTDEAVYLRAFSAVAHGASPYGSAPGGLGYFYPPGFARLGATALEWLGPDLVVVGLRSLNVLGLAATLWIAVRFAALPLRAGILGATLFVLAAPPALRHGVGSGNISLAVVGGVLAALVLWPQRPWLAGVLLGGSTVAKPLAPMALAALAAGRPARGTRQARTTAAAGLAVVAAGLLLAPHLGEFLASGAPLEAWPLRRSVSLHRWLRQAGLPVSTLALLVVVGVGTAVLAHRRPRSARSLTRLAIVASTLATPALWSHTLLLTLPLQVSALVHATRRRTRGLQPPSAFARWELVWVLLAVAAIQLADGIGGGLEVQARAVQLLILPVPVLAPVALALYLDRVEPSPGPLALGTA